MLKLAILFMFSVGFFVLPGQPEVNYEPKRLLKELEKTWGMENPILQELIVPEAILRLNPIQGKYFSVMNRTKLSQQQYIYIGRVNSCRAGGCSISPDTEIYGDTEYFDYFILFDSACTVQQVRVFNYQATHGQEVSAKGWLKQFEGYNGSQRLMVGKDVDAIAGATISVYGITEDIQEKTALFKRLML